VGIHVFSSLSQNSG